MAVKGCEKLPVLVECICHYFGGYVVSLSADAKHEKAVDRVRPSWRNARKLNDYAIIVLGEKRYRVLDLTGERH